jgi:hypothetical protein
MSGPAPCFAVCLLKRECQVAPLDFRPYTAGQMMAILPFISLPNSGPHVVFTLPLFHIEVGITNISRYYDKAI